MATIVGTGTSDILHGTDERDHIWALAGNDQVDGGAGDDFVVGGAGDDILSSSSGFDELTGGDGNDRLAFTGVGGAARGGAGVDTLAIDFSETDDAFTMNGANGHARFGDPSVAANHLYFVDIERLNLTTGSGNDEVIATNFAQINVNTGAGDDRVEGGSGNDIIWGGDGRDMLFGGAGNDELHGDGGNDYVDGGNGNDKIWGDAGNDSLAGGRGGDQIEGGDGDDSLNGGDANDSLDGGTGADVLKGGSGADTFIWSYSEVGAENGIDFITDFDTDSGDVISLRNFASGNATGIHDFNSFIAASHDTEGGVYVSFDGDSNGIFIENVSLADLSADDVTFS